MATDPPSGWRNRVIFSLLCGAIVGGAARMVRWDGGRDTISLINILYGPPGLWR